MGEYPRITNSAEFSHDSVEDQRRARPIAVNSRIAFGHRRLTRRNWPDSHPHRRYRNLWRKTAPDSIRHRRRHMDEENTKAPGFGGFRMLKLRLT